MCSPLKLQKLIFLHLYTDISRIIQTSTSFALESYSRVLNGELYAQRLHKLIYLHLSTDRFMKISLHSS